MVELQKAHSLAQLKNRASVKWREFDEDVLPLHVAEMDFEVAAPIRAKLADMLGRSDVGYLGPIPELAEGLGKFAAKRWGWNLDRNQIFTATDVGVGMVEMGRTIVKPGDQILVNTPVYHNFRNWITELKCELVDAPLHKDGLHYTLDFDAIESAYKNGVKIHYLCNPANPVGTVFTKAELAQLAELAKKYNIIIFSDEIHAPLTHSGTLFTPFLNVGDVAREVGICVTSASKAWNLAGLKCATIITQGERMQELAKSMPPAVHYRASLYGAAAGAVAWGCTDWLESTIATIEHNAEFLKSELDRELPEVGYRPPQNSYLAWLDLTELNLGADPFQRLIDEARVAFNAGVTFSPSHTQFVRFNLGTSEEIITEAVRRIASLARMSKGNN